MSWAPVIQIPCSSPDANEENSYRRQIFPVKVGTHYGWAVYIMSVASPENLRKYLIQTTIYNVNLRSNVKFSLAYKICYLILLLWFKSNILWRFYIFNFCEPFNSNSQFWPFIFSLIYRLSGIIWATFYFQSKSTGVIFLQGNYVQNLFFIRETNL